MGSKGPLAAISNLVPKKGPLAAISPTAWGINGANSIFKRASGKDAKDADKASIAAGNADAAQSESQRRAMDSRRRGYLGLNATGARGVTNPLNSARSTLGGF
jgi:hypothetical protein